MVLDLGWFQAVIAIDVMRPWAGGGSKFYVVLCWFQAIDFMWRVEQLKTHAVHFAIALYDQNLLHLTNSTQAQIRKLCLGGCYVHVHTAQL